jgi:hypothetical protein
MSDLVSSTGYLIGIALGCFIVFLPIWTVYRFWRLPGDIHRIADALEHLAYKSQQGPFVAEPEDAVQKSIRERAVSSSAFGR